MPGNDSNGLDAMTAAPNHHDVLLENNQVRVLDTRLGPGEQTPVHTHGWPSVLYVKSFSPFVRRDAEGTVLVDARNWPRLPDPGEALWSAPLPPHRVENVGDADLHIVAIELKQGGSR